MNNTEEVKMRCCMMCKGSGLVRQRIKKNKDRTGYKACARCNCWIEEQDYKKDNSEKYYKTCTKCRGKILDKYYIKKKSKVN